jgi:hypothetical protein
MILNLESVRITEIGESSGTAAVFDDWEGIADVGTLNAGVALPNIAGEVKNDPGVVGGEAG